MALACMWSVTLLVDLAHKTAKIALIYFITRLHAWTLKVSMFVTIVGTFVVLPKTFMTILATSQSAGIMFAKCHFAEPLQYSTNFRALSESLSINSLLEH